VYGLQQLHGLVLVLDHFPGGVLRCRVVQAADAGIATAQAVQTLPEDPDAGLAGGAGDHERGTLAGVL